MLDRLPAFYRAGRINAVIETPRGSRNKFAFDADSGAFRLGKQLPAGAVFPFDFGFVPSTLGDDGDPIDVLVLLETATFPGCVVRCRLIGVIDGRQTGRSGGQTDNPRLVAVATKSTEYDVFRRLRDLPDTLLDEITHFFVSYNEVTGKALRTDGPLRAAQGGIDDPGRHPSTTQRVTLTQTTARPAPGAAVVGVTEGGVNHTRESHPGRDIASRAIPAYQGTSAAPPAIGVTSHAENSAARSVTTSAARSTRPLDPLPLVVMPRSSS